MTHVSQALTAWTHGSFAIYTWHRAAERGRGGDSRARTPQPTPRGRVEKLRRHGRPRAGAAAVVEWNPAVRSTRCPMRRWGRGITHELHYLRARPRAAHEFSNEFVIETFFFLKYSSNKNTSKTRKKSVPSGIHRPPSSATTHPPYGAEECRLSH